MVEIDPGSQQGKCSITLVAPKLLFVHVIDGPSLPERELLIHSGPPLIER